MVYYTRNELVMKKWDIGWRDMNGIIYAHVWSQCSIQLSKEVRQQLEHQLWRPLYLQTREQLRSPLMFYIEDEL